MKICNLCKREYSYGRKNYCGVCSFELSRNGYLIEQKFVPRKIIKKVETNKTTVVKGEENKFKKWFFENTPNWATNLQVEVPLHNPFDCLDYARSRELYAGTKIGRLIGRIDLLFRTHGAIIVTEIKYYPYTNDEFWYASKALCYSAYYDFQFNAHSIPAVMIPKESIKLEHLIIANKLRMRIYGITKLEKGYDVERIENYDQIRK